MNMSGVAVGLGLLLVIGWNSESTASGYYHECGTPGGQYRMLDEVLYSGSGENEKELKYKVISKVVLSETEGYCIGKTGNKYGFNSERYIQRIEVRQNGETLKLDFYCELASDGLPAGDECTKQVKTKIKRLIPAYDTKVVVTPDAPKQN